MNKLINFNEIIKNKTPLTNDYNIYFLIDKDEIVYIGQSFRGFSNRVSVHKKEGKIFDSIYVINYKNNKYLNDYEALYIWKFLPKYNTSLPFNAYIKTKRGIKNEFKISLAYINKIIKKYSIKLYRIENIKNQHYIKKNLFKKAFIKHLNKENINAMV